MSNQNEKLKFENCNDNVCHGSLMFNFVYPPLSAQIGNLGIYGTAPGPHATDCGAARYARLEIYPDITVEDGEAWSYTLPLNGLGNFNFYYAPDGNGFLSGGADARA